MIVLELPWHVLAPDNERTQPVLIRGKVRQVPTKRYRVAKQRTRGRVAEQLAEQRIRAPLAGRVSVDVTVRFPDRRVRDTANYAKMICDSLVGLAIEDDKWEILAHTSWTAAGVDAENPGATVHVTGL